MRARTRTQVSALLLIAWLVTGGESLAAAPRPLEACVPAEVMAVYFGRPSPEMLDAPAGGRVDQLATWVMALKALGVIPADGLLFADAVGTLPILWRRPHALVLLDATSKQIAPEVYRLDELRAALLIDQADLGPALQQRVQDLLGTYTNADHGSIAPMEGGGVRYHRLTDRRLPEWATIEWGPVGGYFVVTIGRHTFATILETITGRGRSLADDPWFASTHTRLRGTMTGIEVYVDIARITTRVGEDARNRPNAVLAAMQLQQADRLLWTVGFDDRSLRSVLVTRQPAGPTRTTVLVGPESVAPEVAAAIPPQASSYAVIRAPLADLFHGGRQAYLETQSPQRRAGWSRGWAMLQQDFGFDLNVGLLDQLGDHLVFHTYPPHPLGVPLLCTIWIQTKGNRAIITRTLDRMMSAWQQGLEPVPGINPAQTRPYRFVSPQVRRDTDGIWYLQLGLVGPAVAVTDGWIIISHSPEAVRANLAYLRTQSRAPQSKPAKRAE